MSFDLYVWKAPVVTTPTEVNELLDRHYSGDTKTFEQSDDIAGFYDDLRSVVADLDALGDRTDRLITLNLLWGTGDDVLEQIAQLAARHALVLYDPQADQVHPPSAIGIPAQLPPGEANPAWWRRLFGSPES